MIIRLCLRLSRLERDSSTGLEEASFHVVRGTTRQPRGKELGASRSQEKPLTDSNKTRTSFLQP